MHDLQREGGNVDAVKSVKLQEKFVFDGREFSLIAAPIVKLVLAILGNCENSFIGPTLLRNGFSQHPLFFAKQAQLAIDLLVIGPPKKPDGIVEAFGELIARHGLVSDADKNGMGK